MRRFLSALSAFSLLALASCGGQAETDNKPDGPHNGDGDAEVTGVSVLPERVELSVGKTVQLEAIVSPDDAANKVVIWTTSDDKVATVKQGLVTATGDGEADVTATTVDGNFKASCHVVVSTIYVTEIKLTENSATLVIGEEYQINPTIEPDNAENAAIGYSVVSGDAVTVSDAGLVKAVKVGSAKVRVTALDGKGAKAEVAFTVQKEPIYATSFTLTCEEEAQVGKTVTGKINWNPSGTNQKEFTVTSSNTSVATVSGSGDSFTIKALKEGNTTIKVHYTSKSGVSDKSFTFYVHAGAPSIAWNCDWKTAYGTLGSSATPMVPGETYQLKADVSNLNNKNVTYSITSGSSYATVSSSGLLTAKARGTVRVVASSAANPSVKTAEKIIEITNAADKINYAAGNTQSSVWNYGDDLTYYVKRGSSITVSLSVQSSSGYYSRQTLEVSSISSSISSIVTFTQKSSDAYSTSFTISAKTGSYAVKGTATLRVTGTSKTRTVNVYVCEYDYSDIKPGDGLYLRDVSSYSGQPVFSDGRFRGKTSGGEMIWYQNAPRLTDVSAHAIVTWIGTPGESDSKIRDWATDGGTFSCKRTDASKKVHGYAVAVKNTSSSSVTWAGETQDLFESGASFLSGSGNYRGCSISKANALNLNKKYGYDLTLGGIAYNYNRGGSHHISVIHHLYKCDRGSSEGNSGYTAYNDTYVSLPASQSPKSDAYSTTWYNWYTSGWFLPSEAEWADCILGYLGLTTLNSIIGGSSSNTTILPSQPYWTMQQNPDDKTQVRVVLGTTGKSGSYVSKTSAYALVRPIIVF